MNGLNVSSKANEAAFLRSPPGPGSRRSKVECCSHLIYWRRRMSFLFEGRGSESPSIEAVWRGRAGSDYAPICPASGRWHLLFLRQNGRVKVSVEGPLTRATPVTQVEGTEWFGVTFPLGTFLPSVSVRNLL